MTMTSSVLQRNVSSLPREKVSIFHVSFRYVAHSNETD